MGTDFIDIIKTKVDEGCQQNIDIIQVIELRIQRRCRKSNRVCIVVEYIQRIDMYFLCMMAAGPDTFTAVNTELAGDAGFAVADADGLGRTVTY